MKKLITIMLALTLILSCGLIHADGTLNVDADVTLKIGCIDEDAPLSGVKFKLYRAADTDSYGNMTWTGAFEGANIELPVLDQDSWRNVESTLASYVGVNSIQHNDAGITDSSGTLVFPTVGRTMKSGLYLLLADNVLVNDYIYTFAPQLVFLPDLDSSNNNWVYDVARRLEKFTKTPNVNPKQVKVHVLKKWNDGNSVNRPSEITMRLLKNGEPYGSAVLNQANGWSYTWEGLDADPTISWRVGEVHINGYNQLVEFEGLFDDTYLFTVTNSLTPGPGPTPTPPPTPPTGQLWWPVSVLSLAGVLLVAFGLVSIARRKNGDA